MVKCHVIQLLGDLINALGPDYVRYLQPTMGFVVQATDASAVNVSPVSLSERNLNLKFISG
jgi:hypothetical protein